MEKKIYRILATTSILLILITSFALAFFYYDSSSGDLSFVEVLVTISPLIVSLIFFVVIILYLLSSRLTDFIIKPFRDIAKVDLMSDKIENYSETYDELKPIVKKMELQKAEVKRSIAELKANEEFRRNFTANVSHELKTPLTSINGFAEMIEYGMAKDEEDIQKFAGIIKNEGMRLLDLIDSILDLSKLESVKADEILMEDISLYHISKKVLDKLRPNLMKKNVMADLSGESIVYGNYQMIEDLIVNLVDNAIKYNKDEGQVNIEIYDDAEYGVFSVKDTGVGIPEEDLVRIFERFYMVDKSRSKTLGGSGLGLSIVKHIVEFHHGDIGISSVIGEGTNIIFRIPKS